MPKGGGGGGGFLNNDTFNLITPGFKIVSNRDATQLIRRKSPEQLAFNTRFPRILSDLDNLRGSIRPGVSALRSSQLQQVENARSKATGTLRDQLQRRRILGSSFATDAQIRAEREFGELAADVEARSFLTEFDLFSRTLQSEVAQLQIGLDREFKELGIAADVGLQATQILAQNAQFAEQQAFNGLAAIGEGIGNILGIGADFAFAGFSGDFAGATGRAATSGRRVASAAFAGF